MILRLLGILLICVGGWLMVYTLVKTIPWDSLV